MIHSNRKSKKKKKEQNAGCTDLLPSVEMREYASEAEKNINGIGRRTYIITASSTILMVSKKKI